MNELRIATIVLLTACASPTDLSIDERADSLAEGRSYEQRLERAYRVLATRRMPVLVAIVHEGKTQVREFGALREDGVRPENTLIDLNSITKTVTAVMVAKLVDEGKIRLDATLADIFPNVPAERRSITIHQLLTHTAGFREALGDDAEVIDRDAFVRRALRSKPAAPVGERYAYSNVGYGLLAAAIELRTGATYESYLRDTVLRELGLGSIGYEAAYIEARSLRSARGETIRTASWGGHAPSWNLIGNGGLVATLPDFCRFRTRLMEGAIVSDDLRDLIHTPHVPEDESEESFYGYGVVVQEVERVGRMYWHDGGNDVFSAVWTDYSERGDLIVTAGADSRRGDAFEAMQILAAELYDLGP